MNNPAPWNEDELNTLIRLRSEGMSWSEVADSLGEEFDNRDYTANACRKKYHKTNGSEDDLDELDELADNLLLSEEEEEEDNNTSGSSPWSDDEAILLYHLKIAGLQYKDISQILSRTFGARPYNENLCKKKWNGTDWNALISIRQMKDEKWEEIHDEESEKQQVINRTIRNHERLIKREQARTDIIIDGLKSAIYRLPRPKPSDLAPPTIKKDDYSEEHMAVLLSDLHVGAKFSQEETGGLGEYNLDIFKRRMDRLTESVVEIADRHRHMYEIPHLHVFSLGDIVAGMNDVGSWSSCYIDLDIFDQMIQGFAAMRNTLAAWSRVFPKISLYGISGNHGRVGKKGTHKHSSNWDRVIHTLLQEAMAEYSNIEWHIPTTWWLNLDIQNHTFYVCHGEGIRGSMGIPYYGVERAQSRLGGLLPSKPDYTLMGHFHSTAELSTNYGKVIMNGSFMGGDMFSLKDLFRGDRAEQKVFGIHHKKGVTWSYNIHLDKD